MGAWDELRTAFADGKTTEHDPDAIDDRRIEFEDGTMWFPDGAPDPQVGKAGPASLFGLTLMAGMASVVLFVDAHPWRFPSLLPLSACVGLLVLLLRHNARKERAAEARLERGLFLLDDALVLRDPPYDESVPRSTIESFVVRSAVRDGERSKPWVHAVRNGGAEVPLSLTERSLPALERWLEGP